MVCGVCLKGRSQIFFALNFFTLKLFKKFTKNLNFFVSFEKLIFNLIEKIPKPIKLTPVQKNANRSNGRKAIKQFL
jgi:hypothetical protein